MSFIIIYITHHSEESAKDLCNQLLEKKLIACSNIFPMTSAYWWQGAIQHEAEQVSIVKTIPSLWEKVKTEVERLHTYEVPCIMKMEVEANAAYEEWIAEMVCQNE